MTAPLKVSTKRVGKKLILTLAGRIDEHAELPALELAGTDELNVDFGKITAINSVGVRTWLLWLKGLPAAVSLRYDNCPEAIIGQINAIGGFLRANARVSSFFVPYYCDACGNDVSEKIDLDAVRDSSSKLAVPASVKCPKCAKAAKLDEDLTQYLEFAVKAGIKLG